MGLLDRMRAKREAKRRADNERYVVERTNSFGNGLDPASTALLYTTVASGHVEHDEDQSDQSDDVALDDTRNDALDSFESDSDRYHPVDTGTDYGQSYSAPTYDFSGPSDSSSSYSDSSSSSYDSGSSYSDSGSSYSDSGSSY